jgi:hypothetical protein
MEIDKTVCREGYVSREGQKLLLEKVLSVERYNSPCCRMLHQSRGTTALAAGCYISREVQQPLLQDATSV